MGSEWVERVGREVEGVEGMGRYGWGESEFGLAVGSAVGNGGGGAVLAGLG